MARLEIATPSGKSVYQIHDEFVTIGREVGNHLRLDDPAIAPVHLRLIHGQGGYRLEIADTALKVQVNGETCGARALQPNDRIQIGGTVLTFVDEHAAPPPAPRPAPRQASPADTTARGPQPAHSARTASTQHATPAPAAARHAVHHAAPAATHQGTHHHAGQHESGHHAGHHAGHHHHHHGPKKQGKMPPWLMWVSIGAVSSVVLLILLRLLGAGSYYREESSPEHWLQVAEAQFNDRDFMRAIDSCQNAELRKPDAETMQRIRALRERIQKGQLRDQDQAALDGAKHALESMQQLEASYPSTSRPRPVVRELARNAQQWLKSYSEIVRRYPESASSVQTVQDLYDRTATLAQLDKPDDATDVIFAVERRLAPPRPLYREALFVADGYISAHPNDPNIGKLRDRREGVVTAAKAEFDRHEATARSLLAAGQWAAARSELQLMRNVIVIDAWSKVADALDKDIQRVSK